MEKAYLINIVQVFVFIQMVGNMKAHGALAKRMVMVNCLSKCIGIYYYPNGDRYDGEWKNDEKDGKGKTIKKPQEFISSITKINLMVIGEMIKRMEKVNPNRKIRNLHLQ